MVSGMSFIAVLKCSAKILGEACGQNLWWGYDGDYMGKSDGRCAKWVRYEHFLSAWAVGHSADGRSCFRNGSYAAPKPLGRSCFASVIAVARSYTFSAPI
jgi:hypothetical protein